MAVAIHPIKIAFLKLQRKIDKHTVAGIAPDIDRELRELKACIEKAELDEANVLEPVVEPAPELKPPFFPGAFVDKPVETETDGA